MIAGLPYTATLGIGTGEASNAGGEQRYAPVFLQAVSASGTLFVFVR